ncbi:MAG: esterase family protein [Fuerstiella sp.]|nr:esterase family protein [Fuerstiella sp.]
MLGNLRKIFSGSKKAVDESVDVSKSQELTPETSVTQWSSTEIDGHRVGVFDPGLEHPPAGCVLFLHGHGRVMLDSNQTFSALFRQHNLAAVCPDGQRSWWMDRICSEFSAEVSAQQWLMDRVLPFVQERWQIEPPGIALLGVSMGGQGALQLSYRHAAHFPVVAAISPAVDFHQLCGRGLPLDDMFQDAEDARQATVVLNLHPLAWPRKQWYCCDPNDTDWFDGCARLGMKLSSSGILHERDLDTSAGGHTWEYFNHMAPTALQHIVDGLASC